MTNRKLRLAWNRGQAISSNDVPSCCDAPWRLKRIVRLTFEYKTEAESVGLEEAYARFLSIKIYGVAITDITMVMSPEDLIELVSLPTYQKWRSSFKR